MAETPSFALPEPRSIEGVDTGTAGAIGVTERGPTDPVLVTSFAEFTEAFGGALSEPGAPLRDQWTLDQDEGGQWWRFAFSVRGFFENGGQRLYVVSTTERDGNRLSVDDFVGSIELLEQLDDVALCVAPGMWSTRIHGALIAQCAHRGDRFAILDAPDALDVTGILGFRQRFDSHLAALYYPWFEVADSSAPGGVRVAPSGHIAGIYARVDRERGVYKAPVNETIQGIIHTGSQLTKADQVRVNAEGINALRYFSGDGIRVWGARTLSHDPEWRYVNVRRLFIFLEQSIAKGIQWVVFEPNGEGL